MSTRAAVSAAATPVTAQDKTNFIKQPLDEFVNACSSDFEIHKFDATVAGLTIESSVMNEFLDAFESRSER